MLQRVFSGFSVFVLGSAVSGALFLGYAQVTGLPIAMPAIDIGAFFPSPVTVKIAQASAAATDTVLYLGHGTTTPAASPPRSVTSVKLKSKVHSIPAKASISYAIQISAPVATPAAVTLPRPVMVVSLNTAASSPSQNKPAVLPAANVAVGESQFVYIGGLVGGWIPSSAGTQAAYNVPGLSSAAAGAWIALSGQQDNVEWERPGGVDIFAYDGLQLWIKGSKANDQMSLKVYDTDGNLTGVANIADFLFTKKISNSYQRAFIPFQIIDPERKRVGRLSFTSSLASAVSLDSVMFSQAPEGTAVMGYLYTSNPVILDTDLENTWSVSNSGVGANIVEESEASSTGRALITSLPQIGSTFALQSSLYLKTSGFHHFIFYFRSNDAASNPITITFYDDGGNKLGQVRLKTYAFQGDFYNIQKVSIPLADFHAENSNVKRITFSADAGNISEIRLSDIKFDI